MKKILQEMIENSERKEGSTYGIQVYDERNFGRNAGKSFWTNALKIAEKGKIERSMLRQIGNQIRETTGWSDPVDSVSVFAHMVNTRGQDAVVEEKRKRDDDSKRKDEDLQGSSKRQTRSSGKKDEIARPMPEIVMKEASKKEKGKKKTPSFKLKTDIEMMIGIQQVFEERILNSIIEMRLQELLAIVKPEFYATFNNLMKRRRHVVEDPEKPEETRKALSVILIAGEDSQESDEEDEEILVDSNAKQVHFHDKDEEQIPKSHFARTH